jgi:hypothetical protein
MLAIPVSVVPWEEAEADLATRLSSLCPSQNVLDVYGLHARRVLQVQAGHLDRAEVGPFREVVEVDFLAKIGVAVSVEIEYERDRGHALLVPIPLRIRHPTRA